MGKNSQTYKARCDDIRLLIEEAKIKTGFNDEKIASRMGISPGTLRNKKCKSGDPSSLRLSHIWVLEALAGRTLKEWTKV